MGVPPRAAVLTLVGMSARHGVVDLQRDVRICLLEGHVEVLEWRLIGVVGRKQDVK
jgi:hypothetical protein